MICPSCGENNSANFKFCGMCGTSLEQRRPAGAPRVGGSDAVRASQNDVADARVPTRTTLGAVRESQSVGTSFGTSGPSFLGLNQPFNDGPGNRPTSGGSADEPFSGLDSFFEQDEPGVSARGIILMLVLLAVLGGGGWWAYTHYNGAASGANANAQTNSQSSSQNSQANPQAGAQTESPIATSQPSAAGGDSASNTKAAETTPASANAPANSSASTSSSQPAVVPPNESANSVPPLAVEPKSERQPQTPPKAVEQKRAAESKRAAREQKLARADIKPATHAVSNAEASGDKGDTEFKRGEAYLYGRGMPENCDQAIRSLKEASAKQNAKARSAFGTMYATGHCVPRDLPTSYSWFAQALRVDPNNQVLSKDLTAVWNQMTPPERQMAARNK